MKNQTQATASLIDEVAAAIIKTDGEIGDTEKNIAIGNLAKIEVDHALLVAIKDAAELLTAKSDARSREACWHNLKSALADYENQRRRAGDNEQSAEN